MRNREEGEDAGDDDHVDDDGMRRRETGGNSMSLKVHTTFSTSGRRLQSSP